MCWIDLGSIFLGDQRGTGAACRWPQQGISAPDEADPT